MSRSISPDERELVRGAAAIIEPTELRAKLARGVPLIVKLGADPTAPDLHLGHSVVLRALRRYQDLGHRVQFLIGDFTGAIGDPTGRNTTRPQLTPEEIRAAADTYAQQVSVILRADTLECVFNSTWYGAMPVADVVRLASRMTVARMLERDSFERRHRAGVPIALHEFLYPLFQGYDSVAMRADVEIGGTDQQFNMLVGRNIMRDYGCEPQVVHILPLLVGTDGVDKMSKSKGNTIGITEAPTAQVTKTMAITDATLWSWYELLSERTPARDDPRAAKLALAREIVERFHGPAAANAAIDEYERKAAGGAPDAMPEYMLAACPLIDALVAAGLAASRGDARRSITNNAIAIDGVRTTDTRATLAPGTYVLQMGKNRFARVVVT